MNTTTIGSWTDLASLAERFRTESWIFRGLEDAEYTLTPKIGRKGARKALDGTELPYCETSEQTMLDRFIREARPHLLHHPQPDLEWRSLAQHHGLATRLLDWSESPLIAAFFAVKPAGIIVHDDKRQRRDAALLGVPCPNVLTSIDDVASLATDIFAYYPQHLTRRITAQRGLFTIHNQPSQAWQPSSAFKWVIPSSICFDLKLALNKAGINESTLFPDIDGIAETVNWLYKWGVLR